MFRLLFPFKIEEDMQRAEIDGALGEYWVILLCLWIHMLKEDLKVPFSEPKRKQSCEV